MEKKSISVTKEMCGTACRNDRNGMISRERRLGCIDCYSTPNAPVVSISRPNNAPVGSRLPVVPAILRAVRLLALLSQYPLWAVGTMLLIGYAIGKLGELVHLPEITGFIVAGLLIGPSVFGIVGQSATSDLAILTEIALAFIAFTVGGALRRDRITRVGTAVLAMSIGHLAGAGVLVWAALSLAGIPPAVAALMGVIAGASSPGTTVAVVQRERAHGPFVDHLFGVIAVINALAIILFGIVFEFTPLMLGLESVSFPLPLFVSALGDIAVSVLLGAVAGFAVHCATRSGTSGSAQVAIMTTGLLFLTTALSVAMGLSPLLLNMAAGATFVNISRRSDSVFRVLEPLTPPIYALFFVLAGAKFQPAQFLSGPLAILGLVYIAARVIGSNLGVRSAARLFRVDPGIGKHLGLCLIPQAGVALGLVLLMDEAPTLGQLPADAVASLRIAVNIVLMAIFVKEVIGPPLSAAAVRRGVAQTPGEQEQSCRYTIQR